MPQSSLTSALASLAILACSAGPVPEHVTRSRAETTVDAGTAQGAKTDTDGGGVPESIPDCVAVSSGFSEAFGRAGSEAVKSVVSKWLLAAGRDPLSVPVLAGGECDVAVGVSNTLPHADAIGWAYPDGSVDLNPEKRLGPDCGDSRVYLLEGILLHEFAHVFGCDGHPENSGLMTGRAKRCRDYEIDAVALECAHLLRSPAG